MTEQLPPSRRQALLAAAAAGAAAIAAEPAAPAADVPASPLDEITIAELQKGLAEGKWTTRSLVDIYLKRIGAVDKKGPHVNSVIELNPDAFADAEALDKERKDKGPRGPLHGIPIFIKDNIDTADKMSTTAGSLALVGAHPPRDAFVVRQLRKAGALLLGKTNLSEWANIRSSHSNSGWSARGGLTRNPYALDRNPSGSSSGSGAAVSANLCAAALGTETDGSIVSPSSANGLVGLKPTVGLVSRSGIIPISHTQDTAGPLCRTVADAALLLTVIAAADEDDPATREAKGIADYTSFLDPKGLQGARLGVVRKYFGFNDAVDALMEESLTALKKAGAVLVDPADIDTIGKFDETELTVLLYELKADLNLYLNRPGMRADVRSLKEIIDFNNKNKAKEMPYFGQDTFLKAEAKGKLTSNEYLDALKINGRLTRLEGIDAAMQKFKVDAFIAPTAGPAWITDLVNGDYGAGGCSSMAAVAGYPHITVPAGLVHGLPVGISFFGRAWSEGVLLKLAFAYEQATKYRKPPRFLSTADL